MDQDDHMYTDLPTTDPAHTLQALTEGPLPATLSALSASSRGIPSEKDFHFFNNFDEFKLPIQQIAAKSQSLLQAIGGSSETLLRESLRFPGGGDGDFDVEEAYDWLVNVNDEILERIDASLDEYGRLRKEEEEGSGRVSATGLGMAEGGFQVVHGRKKKTKGGLVVVPENTGGVGGESVAGVKVADNKKLVMGAKAKVPFHIPTIRRPQEEFNILVNNGNQPFQHVWLEKSDDGSRFVHPLEKVNVSDFVDWSSGDAEPMAPPPLASTPFKFVEEVKDLKQLAAKLRGVTEFAVDLEHNQYRSFQGLTCLMQISTRNEDYVVDTLKLKIHVGPHLREVFKDPTKRKVMHGADRDIVWLQRDFGIYVCNLFDTGQASRKLKLERNSLEYLLNHFCGVTANKEYQNADWRLRPLPEEMIRYAREDTHYLLHIYDKMRIILLSVPKENENADSPVLEVYNRSYDICTQLYEKELLTENSYLHIYGLQDAGFNAQQVSVVSGLFEWRDAVARAEDESTGYILPNKTLLEIAKQMPVTTSKLRRILKSKHSYVERNLSSVVSIIRHSVQNAGAFEAAAQQLQEARIEMISQDNTEGVDEGGTPASGTPNLGTANSAKDAFGGSSVGSSVNNLQTVSTGLGKKPLGPGNNSSTDGKGDSFEYHGENGNMIVSSPSQGTSTCPDKPLLGKATGATVQVLKKPAGAFGALLGSSSSKRNVDTEKKNKEEMKLDKIRSSVYLPFQSFLHRNEVLTPLIQEPPGAPSLPNSGESIAALAANPKVEDIVVLDDDSDVEQQNDESETVNLSRDAKPIGLGGDIIILEDDSDFEQENNDSKTTDVHGDDKLVGHSPEEDGQDEPVSLSDLSSSFQKCFQSNNESTKTSDSDESLKQENCKPFKPFNYTAAMRFWEEPSQKTKDPDDEEKRVSSDSGRSSAKGRGQKEDGTRDFPPARRRQAFPTTGNRSATFR